MQDLTKQLVFCNARTHPRFNQFTLSCFQAAVTKLSNKKTRNYRLYSKSHLHKHQFLNFSGFSFQDFKICDPDGPDPPTLGYRQTDRRTDDIASAVIKCCRAICTCYTFAKRGKDKIKVTINTRLRSCTTWR